MIPAYELLISNTAVQNLIRESRTFEINTVIETSLDDGMTSIERSLAELVARGEITQDNARAFAFNKRALENIL
jgi:twitching motility protein PilT